MARPPFLRTRAGRLALLGMMALDVFVVPVALHMGLVADRVGDVIFAGTMLVAISAMGTGRGRRAVLAVALAAFGVQFFRFLDPSTALVIIDAALSALALGTFAAMVLVDVFGNDPGPDRLLDVILAYLLVGATFAFLYEVVNVALPGAVLLNGQAMHTADYVYFSLTTMTSVGYGDALAMHPISRSIAMAEALTGQLYVAVLIARFVTVPRPGGGGDAAT